ncbi:MAG: hypothetical protein Q7S53_02480 [bacterium]|nr:hypothetical protein [bacterium]
MRDFIITGLTAVDIFATGLASIVILLVSFSSVVKKQAVPHGKDILFFAMLLFAGTILTSGMLLSLGHYGYIQVVMSCALSLLGWYCWKFAPKEIAG